MTEFTIDIRPEDLDLERCLFSGQVFRWTRKGAEYVGLDGRDRYRILPALRVRTSAGEGAFRKLFNLDADLDAIKARIVGAAPKMETCIGSLSGLRLMQPSDPTETFFSFLCTANNHLSRITAMVAKLAAYGEGGRFPRVAAVASIGEGELRAQGFGYRGATIPLAAREMLARGGDAYLSSLADVGYETAHRELVSVRGIGNKLADCICLYGLHYGEAVPIDTHLWQAACRVFFPAYGGRSLTDSRYREVGDFFRERFGSLAGWAHLFLYFENLSAGRAGRGTSI